jgi:hypothetical protein
VAEEKTVTGMHYAYRGREAEIRQVYLSVARIDHFEATGTRDRISLTAHLVSSDAFRLSQPGLSFVVRRPNGVIWRWPVRSVSVSGARLTAILDAEE